MNKWSLSVAAILCASSAFAAGIGRTSQSITDIYDDGNFFKLNFSHVSPDVTGEHVLHGDLDNGLESYNNFSGMIKQDYGNMSFAVFVDQPFGADVHYPTSANPGGLVGEISADYNSTAVTLLGKYQFNDRFSVVAGLAAETMNADVSLGSGAYIGEMKDTSALGYVIGAAYEIPDIALRLDVTYRSKIEHKDVAFDEYLAALGTTTPGKMDITMPESVDVNFQTGITQSTLLMVGARWVKWSDFEIKPPLHTTLVSPGNTLVGPYEDTITYNVGLGQKINDQLSVLASYSWEKGTGNDSSLLSPTDGFNTITLGGQYKVMEGLEISGGVSYAMIGDTVDDSPLAADWEDNHAWGFGLSLKKSF